MPNSKKITQFIDEQAFNQFTKLRTELRDSQGVYLELVKVVAKLNGEIARTDSLEGLAEASKRAARAVDDMSKANEKVEATSRRVAQAQEEVAKAAFDSAKAMDPSTLRATVGGLDEQIRRQVQLRAEIKSVGEEIKRLGKAAVSSAESRRLQAQATAELAKEDAILRQALQQTNLEIRRQTREQIAAEGSSDQLAARLDQLRGAYRGLSDEQRNAENIGGKLLQQITALDEELRDLDGKQGVYNRNVGNYASGQEEVVKIMNSAIPGLQELSAAYKQGTTIISGAYAAVSTYVRGTENSAIANKAAELSERAKSAETLRGSVAMNVSSKALKSTSAALRLFRIALAATGIGAIVVVLGSLITYLTTTQSGIDNVTKVTRPLAGVFNVLLDVVQKLGKAIFTAFSSPREAIDNIMSFLRERVLPYFELFGSAVKNALTLDREGLKKDLQAMKDLAVNDAREVGNAVGQALSDGWQRGVNRDVLIKEIEEIEIAQARSHGNLRRQMELSAEVSRDLSKTDKERSEAAEDSVRILNLLVSEQVALADKRIELQKLEMSMTEDVTTAQRLQLAELEAERDDIEGNAARRRSRFTSRENRANKSMETQAAKLAALQENYDKERLARIETVTARSVELEAARDKRLSDLYKSEANESKLSLDSRLESLQSFLNKELEINENQANERVRLEKKRLDTIASLVKEGREEEADLERQLLDSNLKEIEALRLEGEVNIAKNVLALQKQVLKDNGVALLEENKKQAELNALAELEALEKSFLDREIRQEDYNVRRKELDKALKTALIEAEIETAEAILEANEALGIDVSEEAKKLADLRIKYARSVRDAEIEAAEGVLDKDKEISKARAELLKELATLAVSLVSSRYEAEAQALEVRSRDLEEETEAQINAINQEGLAEEERVHRIAIVEAQAFEEQKKIDQEQRRLKERQARFDRLTAIANITQRTALAVMSALAMLPPNVPLSMLAGATGAVQLATVLATPIPKFWTGTNYSPEGLAIVGERGPELMIDPSGSVGLSPGSDTLTYLNKGTKIIDADRTKALLSGLDLQGRGTFDTSKLEDASEKQTRAIVNALKGQRTQTTILSKRGLRNEHRRNRDLNSYIKRLLN